MYYIRQRGDLSCTQRWQTVARLLNGMIYLFIYVLLSHMRNCTHWGGTENTWANQCNMKSIELLPCIDSVNQGSQAVTSVSLCK